MLEDGEINKTPFTNLKLNGVVDANGEGVIDIVEVVQRCIEAMGLGDELTVPKDLAKEARPIDLEWRGNHAPEELEKILQHVGWTLVLSTDGDFSLVKIGTGELPTIDTLHPVKALPKSWGGGPSCGRFAWKGTQ